MPFTSAERFEPGLTPARFRSGAQRRKIERMPKGQGVNRGNDGKKGL
jgi:hypothetical protein